MISSACRFALGNVFALALRLVPLEPALVIQVTLSGFRAAPTVASSRGQLRYFTNKRPAPYAIRVTIGQLRASFQWPTCSDPGRAAHLSIPE
jgi:hypothetical protein